jgi:hypothetical protein
LGAEVGEAEGDGAVKNQRGCARCHRSFWAWETSRRCCYMCEPRPIEDTLVLLAIHTGPYNGTGARAVPVVPSQAMSGLPLVPGENGQGR